MSEIKLLQPVQLSIEPQTRLLLVKQGENVIKLTRDSVSKLEKLRKGDVFGMYHYSIHWI